MVDAAWYPDPHDAEQLRYWDGTTWTEHVHVPEAVPPPPNGQPPFAQPPPTRQSSPYRGRGVNDIGEWIRESFKMAVKKLLPCVGLLAIGVLPWIAVAAFAIPAISGMRIANDRLEGFGGTNAALLGVAGLLAIVAMLWGAVVYLAVYFVLHEGHRGRSVGISQSLAVGRRRLGRLLVTYLMMAAIVVAALAVLGGIVAVLLATVSDAVIVLIVALYVILFPVSFWLQVKLAFIPIAAAVAPAGTGLIRLSMRLSNDQFWPVFGRILLLGVLASAAMVPIQIMFAAASAYVADAVDADGSAAVTSAGFVVAAMLFAAVVAAAMLVMQLFVASGMTRMYRDLGGPAEG